jgi:hypothetical protein
MTDYSCTVDGADLIRSDIFVLSVTWGQTIGRHASVAHMHDDDVSDSEDERGGKDQVAL